MSDIIGALVRAGLRIESFAAGRRIFGNARPKRIGFHGEVPFGGQAREFDLAVRLFIGVAFRGPVIDDVQVRVAFFGDPDGNDLYLIEVKKWG